MKFSEICFLESTDSLCPDFVAWYDYPSTNKVVKYLWIPKLKSRAYTISGRDLRLERKVRSLWLLYLSIVSWQILSRDRSSSKLIA